MASYNQKFFKPKLFNPEGNDDPGSRSMIGGNITNILNLNEVKYAWAPQMYRKLTSDTWFPEKVSMTDDQRSIKLLEPEELHAFKAFFSFLIFLDSNQTNNLPNVADYLTAAEIKILIMIQTFQEAIHSQSYAYVIESIIPPEERREIYDYWRKDPVLFERIKQISTQFQDFVDDDSHENFKRVLIANFILEGLYFYNGFNFFYQLASRNKMMNTSRIIRYINRDEASHCQLFRQIIKECIDVKAESEWIYQMFRESTEQEIAWSKHILGDKILGITNQSSEDHTKFLADRRLVEIGLEPLYGIKKNPYIHLSRIANVDGQGDVKENFFEGTVTEYHQSEGTGGWDF